MHQGLKSTQDHDVDFIQYISKSSQVSKEVTSVVITAVVNSYTTTIPRVHNLLCSADNLVYFTHFKLGTEAESNNLTKGKI